ncbi:signal peptide peptidase SppA [Candidatus Dojkabacteria bacterium]|nr:signal peptide peptidase SppA [Candidatus Dojkabacteria bacterium]
MSKKGTVFSLLAILAILVFLCICCAVTFLMIGAVSEYETDSNITEEVVSKGDSSDEIALIDIEGMIASNMDTLDSGDQDMVDLILAKLEKAKKDDSVKAVILRLNTPGGTVYDSHIITQKVKEVKQVKPVISLMGMSATSGGYYISAPANKIVASETSLTGSIGVIVRITDLDGLYEKLGINVYSVTNTQGDMKALDNIDDPKSEDRAILEEVLDDDYEAFIREVMEGRGMTREEVLAIADGSIYSGKKAKKLGLVDELGGLDTAIMLAEEEAGISDAKVVEYDTYIDPFSNFSLLMMSKINPLFEVNEKLNTEPGMYLYYMPENELK